MTKNLLKFFKRDIFLKISIVLLISVLLKIIINNLFLDSSFYIHVLLESCCVFMSLSIFFSLWYSISTLNKQSLLGIGFLAVSIFQALHVIFSFKNHLSPLTEMSGRMSFASRIAVGLIILMFVKSFAIKKLDKNIMLIISLLMTGLIILLFTINQDYPLLLINNKPTVFKVAMELLVIGIYCYSFIKYKDDGTFSENKKSYEDMRLAILLSIPAELYFTIMPPYTYLSEGHIIKIASYLYFFRAIYIHTITYPYKKLNSDNMVLKEKNQILSKTASTLQELLDSFPVALCKYNSEGCVEYVNREFEKLFKCKKEDFIGFHEERVARMLQYDEHVTYTSLSGQKLKLFCQKHLSRNGYIQFFHEIKKQQNLVNFYLQTETILNSFEQCVLMVNKKKQIIMCNSSMEKLLNRSKYDIIGLKLSDLCKMLKIDAEVDPDSPEFDIRYNKYSNQKYQISLYVNETKKEALVHVNSILDLEGEVIGLILVCTDITELENSFEKNLHREKLAILGQLGAGIVHEVRNYLSTVKGRSQIIELMSKNDVIKKHAKNISKDVDDINHIMNEFLFLAKPQNTDLKKASIKDIFQSIRSMISSSSLVSGVNIDINLSDDNKYILCDESQIKQVILNLCRNAVEVFTDKNEAKIVIDSGYNEETNEIFIRVTDNGPGISQENLKKIGTPFFTTKRNGTGLGLSTCFKIIKNHNGRINVESELGKGTSFTVLLPCVN